MVRPTAYEPLGILNIWPWLIVQSWSELETGAKCWSENFFVVPSDMLLFLALVFTATSLWASEPPCSEFEFLLKAHEVQAYSRKDGTPVSASIKKEHCREFFIGTRNWAKSFQDQNLADWV